MVLVQEEIGTIGESKERILELLLGGSKSAGEIAESLQIQKSAARVHLESLQSLGAVRSRFKIEKMGRPKKVYELTEKGREIFPRKYDLFLTLILNKIAGKKGEAEARQIIESIAEDIASGIRTKIDKNNHHPNDLEHSLKVINDASNEMGFASSLGREEKDNFFYIQSRNCILHKVASANQDMICHGLHDKIISKALEGNNPDARIELKECMALGNEYCRHIIRSGAQKMKTGSENRMEASTEVQTYKKMLPTFQRVANRKGLNEPSYKNSSRFQREGSKLRNLLDIKARTTHKALRRSLSPLSERNNYNKLVKLP